MFISDKPFSFPFLRLPLPAVEAEFLRAPLMMFPFYVFHILQRFFFLQKIACASINLIAYAFTLTLSPDMCKVSGRNSFENSGKTLKFCPGARSEICRKPETTSPVSVLAYFLRDIGIFVFFLFWDIGYSGILGYGILPAPLTRSHY